MPFEKGHKKLGGREQGTPNKKTLMSAEEILIKLNINPIERLVGIAESTESTTEQKIRCWQEVAKYTYPKLKSQEVYFDSESNPPTKIELVGVRANNGEHIC